MFPLNQSFGRFTGYFLMHQNASGVFRMEKEWTTWEILGTETKSQAQMNTECVPFEHVASKISRSISSGKNYATCINFFLFTFSTEGQYVSIRFRNTH